MIQYQQRDNGIWVRLEPSGAMTSPISAAQVAADVAAEFAEIVPLVPSLAGLVAQVRAEAERRLAAGTTIAGNVFRCDTASLVRLQGMTRAAERAEALQEPYSVTFRTAAGVAITITTAAEAAALEAAAAGYVGAVLTASAALQAHAATLDDAGRTAFAPTIASHADWP